MTSRGRDALPSIVTLGGMLMAFASLSLTQQGRYEAAAWLLFAAGWADIADGAIARALGAATPFGRQLDSLADLVIAGVAPAFLVYEVFFSSWGFAGVVMAWSWAAFVAARLARFNSTESTDRFHFVGVPCPMAAVVVCQYLVFSRATWGDDGSAWVCAGIIVVLGGLMLSHVPYWTSATLMPRQFFHHSFGPGLVTSILLVIPFPGQAIFVGAAFSIVAAVALHLARRVARPRTLAPRVAA